MQPELIKSTEEERKKMVGIQIFVRVGLRVKFISCAIKGENDVKSIK